jgi:hypothetical protein
LWNPRVSQNIRIVIPGEYDIKFARDDYADILRHARVPQGAAAFDVKGPSISEWSPLPGLQILKELQRLWDQQDRAALAARLTNVAPKLDWKIHREAYRKLKEDFDQQLAKEFAEKLPVADAAVAAYCAYLYQVADPPEHKLRRLKESPRLPELSSALPGEPLLAMNDSPMKAQYLRLKTWRDAVPALTEDAGKDRLVASLNRLARSVQSWAPEVADRCQFESALLQWDYSGPVPDGLNTTQPDFWRWQAHAMFRPGEPQPDVLSLFAQYAGRGGHPDRYDVVLALYEAFYCWDNYVRSVQNVKDAGVVVNDKGVEHNVEKAYNEAVKFYGPAAQKALKMLVSVLSGVQATTVQESVNYLEERRQENETLLMARCLGELPALAHVGFHQAVQKLKSAYDKTMTAEFNILKDLLESGRK